MGIYIKDMEMPKSCYHCVWMFRDKPNGKVYCTATETNSNIFAADQWLDISDVLVENRHSSCPLVPVPPHGDLIDRDALMDDIIGSMVFSGREVPKEAAIVQKVLDIVRDANAIIPAEEADHV